MSDLMGNHHHVDFDPVTAEEFTASASAVAAEIAGAAATTGGAAAVVPGLGLVGEQLRAAIVAAVEAESNALSGLAGDVDSHGRAVESARQSFTDTDTGAADRLTRIGDQ